MELDLKAKVREQAEAKVIAKQENKTKIQRTSKEVKHSMVEMSENAEATLVLAGTIGTAATTYIAALPIPVEIKIPTVTLIGTISAALLAFWKTKVNKPKT